MGVVSNQVSSDCSDNFPVFRSMRRTWVCNYTYTCAHWRHHHLCSLTYYLLLHTSTYTEIGTRVKKTLSNICWQFVIHYIYWLLQNTIVHKWIAKSQIVYCKISLCDDCLWCNNMVILLLMVFISTFFLCVCMWKETKIFLYR